MATGWLPGRLSDKGRLLAGELGKRRRADSINAVFTSDLRRAVETAEIAFAGTSTPILHDWRLRECNYGEQNGMLRAELLRALQHHPDFSYPAGESWRQAVQRVGRFLDDLRFHWEGSRVLVIGHIATRWALEYYLNKVSLEALMETEFNWRKGWEYLLK
ncbi:histidine phosphatase family protein [bacterium]|nr:histidine phosphatase family protein [bacterium]